MGMCNLPDFILAVLVIFCPPAVAWIKTRRQDLGLNFILTLLVWFPGMLRKPGSSSPNAISCHLNVQMLTCAVDAWYLIIKHPDGGRKPVALDARVEHVNTAYVDAPYVEAQAPVYPQQERRAVEEVHSKPPKYGK